MSRQAIAAALARDDLVGGERLVAFSLASFAGRDDRAWPGASAAAVRAGLSRSRYLYVRDRLVERGLVVVESEASGRGRGRASLLALPFVLSGPWWEGEINAELFEAVLSRTRRRGPSRLLLAAMAALADADAVVRGLSSEELSAAAGMADRTYRRARQELLESGELDLVSGAGGRGNTNVWQVRASVDAPAGGAIGSPARRVMPPAGARPLLATVASSAGENRPALTGAPAERAVRTGQFRSRTVLSGPGFPP
jgi:GNAT superfamily N-acetyltransferase